MKTMRHIQTWLLITLLTLSASNDVWGKRLETNWNGNEVRESQTQGNQRGYTDHEHLDSIGLIHMNGRVYEAAEVARGIATGEITGQEAVTGAVITAGLNLVGGAAFKTVNKVTPPVVEEQIKDVVDKALRKNTDAQQNLSDKPTRTADAPDGRGGNNDVEVNDNVNGDATKGLPDNALVVRGGADITPDSIVKGTGKHPSGVTGFSVESKAGACLGDLCKNIRNNQVGVTTVGDIRARGGDVLSTSGRSPNHATVTGLGSKDASDLLSPSVKNPVPKGDRN